MTKIFPALADDTRLRILLLLQHMELSVGELAEILDQSQPRVSRHVRILCEANLVERRKEGSWVFLRSPLSRMDGRAADHLNRLLHCHDVIGEQLYLQNSADVAKLSAIRNSRQQQAQKYFAGLADQWDALRALHIPEEKIETVLLSEFAGLRSDNLLDIGTGTGRMVELLAGHAEKLTALDKSSEMLKIARAKLQHLPPERLELVQGDFNQLPLPDRGYDLIILHQVLHFAQNPQQVIIEAGRVAKQGANIAIIDFAHHQQEILRERGAHERLGFADEQIFSYFDRAGFSAGHVHQLPGSPLTVKIWLGVKKPYNALPLGPDHKDTDHRDTG